jgi:nitrite reductase/ring-hydroxylating ferredoxin subunit
VLMCSHHVAMFRLEDGECFDGPCRGSRLTSIAIQNRNGAVCIA